MRKLLFVLTSIALLACNNNYQRPSDVYSTTLENAVTPHYSSPKDAAPEIARGYVKSIFSSDCKFEKDVVIENTMVDNRYQVMQKFKSKKQGVELSYVYKIFIQYFDGDVNDVSSWEYGQLVVEEVNNGNQSFYNGDLNNRIKRTVGVGNTVEFAGVEFKIIDARIGTSIAFSHKETLTNKQIAAALREMHETYGYKTYHLYHENRLDKDYLCWQATGNMTAIFDYEKNKIYESLETDEKGKAL